MLEELQALDPDKRQDTETIRRLDFLLTEFSAFVSSLPGLIREDVFRYVNETSVYFIDERIDLFWNLVTLERQLLSLKIFFATL